MFVVALDHFTRLNKEFCSDLHMFLRRYVEWNQLNLQQVWLQKQSSRLIDLILGGVVHFVAVSGYNGNGLADWKELVPIAFSCSVWGPLLRCKGVLFQCDNISVVQKGSSKIAHENCWRSLVSEAGPDCTSQTLRELFSSTLGKV